MAKTGYVLAGLLFLASPAATEEEDPWRLDASIPASVDQIVGDKLAGASGATVLVGSTDLDQDGFPEFFVFADGRNALMRLGLNGWTDISGGVLDGVAAPGDITLREEWFNGFQILRAAGELRVFRNGAFASLSAIVPETLDSAAFAPACAASPGLGGAQRDLDTGPADPADYCACLAEEWALRGAGQRFLDAWTQAILDRSGLDLSDAELARQDMLIGEVQIACDLRFGLDQSISRPAASPFDGAAAPQTAVEFVAACAAQDHVAAHMKVRTADRAFGLCACMAVQMNVDGLDAEGFRLAAALYSGDMSEAEVLAIAADPVEKSDAAASACFRRLPTN